jgi:hypothetical protein
MSHIENILPSKEGWKFVEDFKNGKIPLGLGIDCDLDNFLRFKHGQFNMINGHDNVGKTDWMLWYFVCLSIKHNIKWDIFSSENSLGSLKIKLLQFWTGQKILGMTDQTFYRYQNEVDAHFNFFDTKKHYTAKLILDTSRKTESNGLLIDPYNSLTVETGNKHQEDYNICRDIRLFCKQTDKSCYVNTHLVTEAARKKYHKDHDYAGHVMPPEKADTEGGQKFANRADDFISVHRMVQHDERWNITEIYIRKVKETLTGGNTTKFEEPLEFRMVDYCKFFINNINPLERNAPKQIKLSPKEDIEIGQTYSNPTKGAMAEARNEFTDDEETQADLDWLDKNIQNEEPPF